MNLLKHEIFVVGNFPLKFNCLVLERDRSEGWTWVWRNDSVFRSAFCSCRGPGLSSSTRDGLLTSASGYDASCWPLRELHSCALPLQLKKEILQTHLDLPKGVIAITRMNEVYLPLSHPAHSTTPETGAENYELSSLKLNHKKTFSFKLFKSGVLS